MGPRTEGLSGKAKPEGRHVQGGEDRFPDGERNENRVVRKVKWREGG